MTGNDATADSSAAQRTIKLCAASVEMTVFREGITEEGPLCAAPLRLSEEMGY
jgi:hypothetical protein